MPNNLTHGHTRRPLWGALLAASLLLTPLATPVPATAQQEESSLFMRVYVESFCTCPLQYSIAGYTSIVIEGKSVPDAEGYIPATVHGITDLVRRGNLTLHASHFEGDYPLAVRLKTQVIGLNQTIQVIDFEPLALNPKPTTLACSYIDGDGSVKQIFTDEDFFFRQMINTSKLMTSVLEGLQENSEGVLGVEGVATNGAGLIKVAAQWFPGKPWANMQVEPDAKGLFINNVQVDINMDYTPNWGEPARYDGLVSIKPSPLPWEKIPQGAPTKVRRTLKPAGMQPGSSPAEGFVDLTTGGTSSNRASTPYRVSGPQVVVAKDEVGATKSNNEVVYKYERAIPKEP